MKGLLRLRAGQAREDWESARKEYRELWKKLEESAKESQIYNCIRKQKNKMVKHYSKVYKEGKKEHIEKVKNLKLNMRRNQRRGESRL